MKLATWLRRLGVLFLFLPMLHAQQVFELSCPAGSNPLPFGTTYNPVTDRFRAFACVDSFGTTTIQGTILPTPPFLVNNATCSTLNTTGTSDAGCAAAWNTTILRSIGSTANNMRHNVNLYLETDLHQTGAGLEFYGLGINSSVLLDAGSTGAASQRVTGITGAVVVQDLASSGITLQNVNGAKLRAIIGANAHVANLVQYLAYAPSVAAGAVVTNLYGFLTDNPTITGTVSNSVGGYLGSTAYQYGVMAKGSIQAAVFHDAPSQAGGICHGTAALPATIHDCHFNGTGTPEGAITANIGSTYSRLDGGAGTSFYVKESGVGNTGWVAK